MEKNTYIPRLLKTYREEIVPQLRDKFGCKNNFALPHLKKIVINMGVGSAAADAKLIEKFADELAKITGQKPKICKARKAISNFKLRKGMSIGCCVTLRRYRMYDFLDRLITVALPRIKDFRGLPYSSFDGRGNYTFGLVEQTIFPEVNIDTVTKTQGMSIAIETSTDNDLEARELLKLLGFPFRR